MLYLIDLEAEPSSALDPVEFFDLEKVKKVEKYLEEIIAYNLVDVLFQEARLLPIFQERQRQAEADLYAVDRSGNLVIFELKRGAASSDAVLQVLRYGQQAAGWRYERLNKMYQGYVKKKGEAKEPDSLQEAHRNAHSLPEPLQPHEFNHNQHMRIVGNAADEELITAVDYWKRRGISIDFVPYRLYSFDDGKQYFELFSFPYDVHRNPAERKGVLFDTNASWNKEAIWEMMEKRRVAAYGDARRFADHIEIGDLVFFYHRGNGVIAAGEVRSKLKKVGQQGKKEWYREVKFLTPVPTREEGIKHFMSPFEVSDVTGKSFFWARTIKVPYLNLDEARTLLERLQERLKGS